MRGLGEQIAVLDGVRLPLDPNDGRLGQHRPSVDQYAKQIAQDVLQKLNMIAATNGSNYGGGSNYYPGGALMPSSIGLAGLRGMRGSRKTRGARGLKGLRGFGDVPSVLPPRFNVISPSGGVNHGGGSSYAEGLPLLPSNSGLVGVDNGYGRAGLGLAAALIDGGYGRAGLGASLINGGYGRAGLGGTGTAVDEDLAAAAEAVAVARKLDPTDGRIGQFAARVDEYGRAVKTGVLERSDVIDPSEGGNYSGGSTYYEGAPLLPSTVGLAGLSGCGCGLSAVPTASSRVVGAASLRGATRPQLLAHYARLKNLAATYFRLAAQAKNSKVRAENLKNATAVMREVCKLRVMLRMPLNADCIKLMKSAPAQSKYGNIGGAIDTSSW